MPDGSFSPSPGLAADDPRDPRPAAADHDHDADADARIRRQYEAYAGGREHAYYGLKPAHFTALLEQEYPALRDATYLDHAASPPAPPLSLLAALPRALAHTLLSNPHSLHSPSAASTASRIAAARARLLGTLFLLPPARHHEWLLVFTAGATAGCRLVAEAFDWRGGAGADDDADEQSDRAQFVYTKEAHTSVVGIRGVALRERAPVYPLDLAQTEAWIDAATATATATTTTSASAAGLPSAHARTLFAFPAQCNATGRRLDARALTAAVKRAHPRARVLVDAAALLATGTLDLGAVPVQEAPDFVVASLYKPYAYPTGLGVLLIKRSAVSALTRTGYFGGGTVDALSVSTPAFAVPRGTPRAHLPSYLPPHSLPSPSPLSPCAPTAPTTPPAAAEEDTLEDPDALHARFEHGTLPFLEIAALGPAMDAHARLFGSLARAGAHAAALAAACAHEMRALTHANGRPVCRVYGPPPLPPPLPPPPPPSSPASASASATAPTVPPPGARFVHPRSGPTLAFTLLRPSGSAVGHVELARLAALNGVHLRAGALCNLGAVAGALGLGDDEIAASARGGGVCWDEEEFGSGGAGAEGEGEGRGEGEGKPTGIGRVSFGASSTVEDVQRWVRFLKRFWTVGPEALQQLQQQQSHDELGEAAGTGDSEDTDASGMVLGDLVVYPIKSCGGISIPRGTRWPVEPHGLQYDREWMLVDPASGRALSQKRHPRMCLVRPAVDRARGVLRVRAGAGPDAQEVCVPLPPPPPEGQGEEGKERGALGRVCADVVRPLRYPDSDVDRLLSAFLGIPCALARLPPTPPASHAHAGAGAGAGRHAHFPGQAGATPVPILLSNESPFLLLNEASVDAVNAWLAEGAHAHGGADADAPSTIKTSCFRGNLVLRPRAARAPPPPNAPPTAPALAFAEDAFDLVRVGTQVFQALAPCRRCQMVCVDQDTGARAREPYNVLSVRRRDARGRLVFGVHVMHRRDLSPAPYEVGAGERVVAI